MGDWVSFDSHSETYKRPFGAAACGGQVELALAVQADRAVEEVMLVLVSNGEKEEMEMQQAEIVEGQRFYKITFAVPSEPGLLWYYFRLRSKGQLFYYGNNQRRHGGLGQLTKQQPPPYQLTVYRYDEETAPGSWYLDGVVYHIFVDRFYNGNEGGQVLNPKPGSLIHGCWDDTPVYLRGKDGRIIRWDFFGGNLNGIRKKLPYFRKLGVTVLYLSPVFTAPSNHKYDTADYLQIDPMFGTEKDLRRLCAEAAEVGIYVILDGVFSHTGSDSIYFNKEGNYPVVGACQSKDSPYYFWYRFLEYPEKYECWWGIDTLPNVNELEPSYLEFILRGRDSVVRYWMRTGVRGWRLDVADELPVQFLRELRQTVKAMDNQAVVIGEVWEDASNKVSYGEQRQYFAGDQLDGVTNYPFRQILLDYILGRNSLIDTHYALMSMVENYPLPNLAASFTIIGSHDVPRILTLLGTELDEFNLTEQEWEHFRLEPQRRELAKKRLKLLSLFQFTFPGVPCVYYGDEAGLEGYRDPYNRGTFPWGREDLELQQWYMAICRLRRDYAVFRRGNWLSLGLEIAEDNPGCRVFGFRRCWQNSVAVAMFNPDLEKARTVLLRQSSVGCTELAEIFPGQERLTAADNCFVITLAPLQGRVFYGETG